MNGDIDRVLAFPRHRASFTDGCRPLFSVGYEGSFQKIVTFYRAMGTSLPMVTHLPRDGMPSSTGGEPVFRAMGTSLPKDGTAFPKAGKPFLRGSGARVAIIRPRCVYSFEYTYDSDRPLFDCSLRYKTKGEPTYALLAYYPLGKLQPRVIDAVIITTALEPAPSRANHFSERWEPIHRRMEPLFRGSGDRVTKMLQNCYQIPPGMLPKC